MHFKFFCNCCALLAPTTELLRFFDDPARRAAYGERAKTAVARRCGVVGRCADELLEAIG